MVDNHLSQRLKEYVERVMTTHRLNQIALLQSKPA
jgi:hypothetical protein